ncbi:tetratricopeptide repeat protein [Agrobacterium vitis]|uniref:tetratricopeptide repeat protein n=1 Tax=Agrobacterium vitis TaxID=373 RepID=UPI0018D2549C|nr:tetratricopeptide repeat protein [Agrobacterium vitis]
MPFALGEAAYESKKYKEAASHFRRATELRPEWGEAWANYGECLRCLGRLRSALTAFDRAIQLSPTLPAGYRGRGVVLRKLGKTSAAIVSLNKTVDIAPGYWRNWTCLAEALAADGNQQLAIVSAQKAIALDPEAGDAHFVMGNLLLRSGDADSAVIAFTRVLEIEPSHAHALNNLAACHFYSNKIDLAFSCQCMALDAVVLDAPPAVKNQSFDTELAKRALLEIKETLDKAGVEFFLVAGTLLGFVREGNFLGHDKDIDLGIFDIPSENIEAAFRGRSAFKLGNDFVPSSRNFTVYYEGVAIDFFRYTYDGDHLICGFNDDQGNVRWRFSRFGLSQREYFGQQFNVPDPPEAYLEQAYGDWRTPRRIFDPVQSSPARHRQNEDLGAQFLTFNKVFMSVIAGEFELAREYLRQASVNPTFPDAAQRLVARLSTKLASNVSDADMTGLRRQ